MTIRTRLALIYATAVALTIVVVGTVIWFQLGDVLRAELGQRIDLRLGAVQSALENGQQAGLQEGDADTAGTWVILFGSEGSRLESSAGAPDLAAVPSINGPMNVNGRPVMVRTERMDGGLTLVAGLSLEPVAAAQAALAELIGFAGLVAILVSGLGGWWLAGRALAPVATMTAEAAAISQADLERRLQEPESMDELGVLARTLNSMLDRVADSVGRQRSFLASASHDLRTPLAALATELELADDARVSSDELRVALRAARADVARLADLANDLLELVAAEASGRPLLRTPTRMSELLDSVIRRVLPLAQAAEVEVTADSSDIVLSLDRVRVEQAVGNLVVNAIAVSRGGSGVEVVVRHGSSGESPFLEIEVLDRGPGVPQEEREFIFEPFHRGSRARGAGSGLGLATARAAVEAHGGQAGVADRPGGGARFWLRFPA
ncbi:MAG: HAMP domain-containing sensor histidine kinase [Candidatus Limnocylindria bacterium]